MPVRTIGPVDEAAGPALVVGRFADGTTASDPDLLEGLPWLDAHLESRRFTGKPGQAVVVPTAGAIRFDNLVVVGLGDLVDHEGLRQASAEAAKAAPAVDRLVTTLHHVDVEGAVRAVVEGHLLGGYRFDVHKSSSDVPPVPDLEMPGPLPDGWQEQVDVAEAVAGAVVLARDLVNEPPAGKGPADLADRVAGLAAEAGLEVEIWEEGRLADEGMGGILGVGQGSHRPPRLLRLGHHPAAATGRLALVGKGITFDSGGLSIKTAEYMMSMKTDMAGAAAVVAATLAIARLGIPVDVTAYAPLAENMPGGGAQRPGDVLRCRNGKTIEVLNTDAEGRLVLADALALAAESEPDLIVDAATLTGACHVALGDKIAGLFTNVDAAGERVLAAADRAGERIWPLPLPRDYRENIDSDVADMKNTGSNRYGGAINAAMLLAEFVGESPWVHLDIAGPAWFTKAEHYIPKGGTGFGVRTLVELAREMSASGR